jgi:two-component system sensor histidine kinase UhpB
MNAVALRVLLAEDNEDDAHLLVMELQRAGYLVVSERVDSAAEMAAMLDQREWDIVIADYSMPSFSGLDALTLVKDRRLDVPFIIVSGTIGEDVAVAAMKAGAHDYLIKDNLARLAPAVERELREAAERRQLRRAEAELRDSEDRYRRLVVSSPEAIFVIVVRRIAYVNEAGVRLFGAARADELTGRPILDLVQPDSRGTLEERFSCAERGETTGTVEGVFQKLDGSQVDVEVSVAPFVLEGEQAAQAFVRDVSERKRSAKALREANIRLQSLSGRMLEVQENERRHIAHELHDEIGQALTAVKLHLQAAQKRGVADGQQRLDECVAITDHALDQVRNLSLNLRPSQLDDLGLFAALRWHIGRQAAASGLDAHFEPDELAERLDPRLETACFRVVQEALTNVVRHARARSVWIRVKREGNALFVSVKDDGVGFDVSGALSNAIVRGSLGLLGMEERVTLAGGSLRFNSTPGQGAEVAAQFPLRFAKPRTRRTQRTIHGADSSHSG